MINKNGIYYVAISLIAILAIGGVAYGYAVSNNVNVTGDYNYYEAETELETEDGGELIGATPGTSVTIDKLIYGSEVSTRLDFTAGATTTPGGLFAMTNYGTTKVCTKVELDITTGSLVGGADGAGSAMDFSVTTSTSLTDSVGNAGASIIATSTVASSTAIIIDNVGSNGVGIVADGISFLWETGVNLIGKFDVKASGSTATSSNVYTGMAGNVYITCHERN